MWGKPLTGRGAEKDPGSLAPLSLAESRTGHSHRSLSSASEKSVFDVDFWILASTVERGLRRASGAQSGLRGLHLRHLLSSRRAISGRHTPTFVPFTGS